MIALAHNYEKAFGDSMLELDYLITGKAPKCLFMQVVKNDGDFSYTVNFDIAYSPNTSEKINTIMRMVQERYVKEDLIEELKPLFGPQISGLGNMSIETTCKIFGFADEKALVNFVTDSFANQCNNSLIGGIVFDDKFVNAPDDTQELAYKIRLSNTKRRFNAFGQGYQPWDTKLLFSNWPFSGPVDQGFAMGGTPGYWDEGFLTLQRAVDISAAYYLNGLNTTPALLDENYLQLARFPFPSFSTRIIEIGSLFLPTIFVFSLMTSVIYITRSIVMEKENRLKEYMRVMGLSQWIQWVAHFIINYAKILVVVVAATILMHFVSKQTDITITLVFLSLYAFNAVYFSFAISCFMQSGTVATLMAVVGWILLYFWSSFFLSIDLQKPYSFGVRILNCLNPNVALGLGLNMIAQYESQANGLHWNQVQYPSSPDEKITMVHILVMLLVDGFIFAFITFYVEAVNPTGEGSLPTAVVLRSGLLLRWLKGRVFVCFQPSYWCPGHAKRSHEEFDHPQTNGKIDLDAKRNTKIRIVGLTKRYGTGVLKQLIECNFSAKHKKLAVNNLSLDMEEGEITALLGHNGAGKSTTISMLTGVTSPTNGTAFIDGYDIRNSLSLIRKQLGYCPQYNILVNRLTVFEHLEFFCHLKERPWNPEEAMALLRRLQLEDKKDTYAGKPVGRTATEALVIVIVDEPTSGMDVNARHETWTLLQKEKTDRTILLTTHYMEEADLLGDKIVILAHGEKQCSGTSMELKKQYGSGYQLVVVYKQNDQERLEDVNRKTENLLKEHCSNVVCKSVVGTEAIFLLPEEERPKFSQLFTRLEAQQKQLGITSFGVSVTTMEEVFLRVNDAADEQLEGAEDKSSTSSSTNSESALLRLHQIQTSEANRNGNLFWPHFKAMFIKRILYYRRRWTQFIPQLIVPHPLHAAVPVKEISFHTTTRSCFGLLGVNGAGKTSTFKMLTGENPITSGDAFINGFSVKNDWRQFEKAVIPEVVDAIVETIDIRRHAQRQIKTYSGGNKRRLSLGMALVGMPPVLMLDEPTTGVDPKARRAIWDILAQLRSLGSAIVLTSHSMEECEALCTSLSIMSAGRFRCFGNPQHIKTKYGSGYTLLIKVRSEEDVERARAAILRKFPDSTVKEEHMLQINFELKRTKAQRWSTLFDNMELLCAENGIVDYSLSQTTLEQIFLQFSREVEMTHDLPRTGTFVEIDLNTRF
ncbi:ATP-binding cassette sub-family A member 3 [Aphelenchoides fujianensis]|nr:ATP-binding cassette sub-family A member 3 [Aphelenchoides fujianensis]